MQELIKALLSAQKEFPAIPKNKKNPFHNSMYADLDSILDLVNPVLRIHGLLITQLVETDLTTSYSYESATSIDSNERDKTVKRNEAVNLTHPGVILRTKLFHESGEYIESTYPIAYDTNPQKRGSEVTYARRYAICALLNITADTDDDGNGAAVKPAATRKPSNQAAKTPTQAAPATTPGNSKLYADLLQKSKVLFSELKWEQTDIVKWMDAHYNVKRRDELSLNRLDEMVKHLERLVNGESPK
jgi:hypothetical protein